MVVWFLSFWAATMLHSNRLLPSPCRPSVATIVVNLSLWSNKNKTYAYSALRGALLIQAVMAECIAISAVNHHLLLCMLLQLYFYWLEYILVLKSSVVHYAVDMRITDVIYILCFDMQNYILVSHGTDLLMGSCRNKVKGSFFTTRMFNFSRMRPSALDRMVQSARRSVMSFHVQPKFSTVPFFSSMTRPLML